MKKDRLINRNPNLTLEQKSKIIELLGKHPSYENKVDWNKSNSLTYEDFLKVLKPLYINELDPRGLVEGEDYDIIYESDGEVLYSVYTYEASVVLASNSIMPKLWTELPKWCGKEEKTDEAHAFGYFDPKHENMKPGAKWCISMQTSDRHWEQYTKDFHFYFWFKSTLNLKNSRKIVIGVYRDTWQVGVSYNEVDEDYGLKIPPYIMEAINKDEERGINRIKSKIKLNPSTNRYDYNGDLYYKIIKYFISEDGNGFTINFGEIKGNFKCSSSRLKSLKGAPQKVGGYFNCSYNQLVSLEGAPKEVGGWFDCSSNQLTSLKGAPQKVGGDFDCYNNPNLHSLDGIGEVGGRIYKEF